jgi:hypothetical protein
MNGAPWSHRAAIALLVLAVMLPIAGLLFPVFGLPSASSNLLVGLLIAGVPEMLCLMGVALLGRSGFPKRGAVPAPASRFRYYGGLAYCLLNGLPLGLYAYAPEWMPGGAAKYIILAVADIGFVLSVLLMGGEFWEKFRRLFIWEGKA